MNLRGANLIGADLRGADLNRGEPQRGEPPSGRSSAGQRLTERSSARRTSARVDLTRRTSAGRASARRTSARASLREANLDGANLREANLSGANLRGADLTNPRFGWTTFARRRSQRRQGPRNSAHVARLPSASTRSTIPGQHPRSLPARRRRAEDFIPYMQSLVGKPIQFYSCFISYSSKDEAFAERLYADLQGENVRCWFAPEDLKIGDKFRIASTKPSAFTTSCCWSCPRAPSPAPGLRRKSRPLSTKSAARITSPCFSRFGWMTR